MLLVAAQIAPILIESAATLKYHLITALSFALETAMYTEERIKQTKAARAENKALGFN